ncbi:uncharacterized protein LOC125949937 [Anopheles darlingi]|uniref:uncharacterized protein LOC125949937 n=1 Tax=Anopheles darlingi TaxID=43151 RepID=UPI0021001CE8|nr:uncharacterized protein LOC125949937 [Anopheles darlingi]
MAHSAPIINTTEEKIEQPSGVIWNITCKANYPIVWKGYDAHFNWTPPNVSSSSFLSDKETKYVSILIISNTSAATVGRFYCVKTDKIHEHLDDMLTEGFASSFYLFVYDYKQPLVPTNEKAYYTTHDKLVIPCKPSYPDIEVELCNKDEKCLTVSDTTEGFKIPKTSSIISEDGMLYCKCDNASYAVHILPTEAWLGLIDDRDNIAGPEERITHTCSVSIVPGDKVKVSMNTKPNYQSTDDDGTIQVEALKPEVRYPIAFILISAIHRTPLNTRECDVINLHCNVTGMTYSKSNWYKNGVTVGSGKQTTNFPEDRTDLSFEGFVRRDDPVFGEYECKMEKPDEAAKNIPQIANSIIVAIILLIIAALCVCVLKNRLRVNGYTTVSKK